MLYIANDATFLSDKEIDVLFYNNCEEILQTNWSHLTLSCKSQ